MLHPNFEHALWSGVIPGDPIKPSKPLDIKTRTASLLQPLEDLPPADLSDHPTGCSDYPSVLAYMTYTYPRYYQVIGEDQRLDSFMPIYNAFAKKISMGGSSLSVDIDSKIGLYGQHVGLSKLVMPSDANYCRKLLSVKSDFEEGPETEPTRDIPGVEAQTDSCSDFSSMMQGLGETVPATELPVPPLARELASLLRHKDPKRATAIEDMAAYSNYSLQIIAHMIETCRQHVRVYPSSMSVEALGSQINLVGVVSGQTLKELGNNVLKFRRRVTDATEKCKSNRVYSCGLKLKPAEHDYPVLLVNQDDAIRLILSLHVVGINKFTTDIVHINKSVANSYHFSVAIRSGLSALQERVLMGQAMDLIISIQRDENRSFVTNEALVSYPRRKKHMSILVRFMCFIVSCSEYEQINHAAPVIVFVSILFKIFGFKFPSRAEERLQSKLIRLAYTDPVFNSRRTIQEIRKEIKSAIKALVESIARGHPSNEEIGCSLVNAASAVLRLTEVKVQCIENIVTAYKRSKPSTIPRGDYRASQDRQSGEKAKATLCELGTSFIDAFHAEGGATNFTGIPMEGMSNFKFEIGMTPAECQIVRGLENSTVPYLKNLPVFTMLTLLSQISNHFDARLAMNLQYNNNVTISSASDESSERRLRILSSLHTGINGFSSDEEEEEEEYDPDDALIDMKSNESSSFSFSHGSGSSSLPSSSSSSSSSQTQPQDDLMEQTVAPQKLADISQSLGNLLDLKQMLQDEEQPDAKLQDNKMVDNNQSPPDASSSSSSIDSEQTDDTVSPIAQQSKEATTEKEIQDVKMEDVDTTEPADDNCHDEDEEEGDIGELDFLDTTSSSSSSSSSSAHQPASECSNSPVNETTPPPETTTEQKVEKKQPTTKKRKRKLKVTKSKSTKKKKKTKKTTGTQEGKKKKKRKTGTKKKKKKTATPTADTA